MDRKVNFRLSNELYNYIEEYMDKNNLDDFSDSLREILEKQKDFDEGNFLFRLSKGFSK